ncbi:MAG: phosphoenolpyruvate carboxylase [Pseudomonadota bacterium]
MALSLSQALRDDVRLLGDLLGQVMSEHRGDDFVDEIENIRALAKDARNGTDVDWDRLSDYLSSLPEDDLIDIARAFNQFLNLVNIAEQHHANDQDEHAIDDLTTKLSELEQARIELVLTAHPTEVLRRTLIQKYDAIGAELADARNTDTLKRLIAEAWHTDEIRREKPTPQDEAKWGFAVIENSLWFALPAAMRELDRVVGFTVPYDIMPFAFASWMGGDRDGNPLVTSTVTREVLRLARWMAADLLIRDVTELNAAMSMTPCTPELLKAAGTEYEPYRAVLKPLRDRLIATRDWAETEHAADESVILRNDEVLEPLALCYESLKSCGLDSIANGPLLDTLRRTQCFGVNLLNLDIRQHSGRHADVLAAITAHLDEPDYSTASEAERQTWLLKELQNRRPLFPGIWPQDDEVQEVLNTFRAIAEGNASGIGVYIISMATSPSDVLAVALLLKEAGVKRALPIVPLFETLADLEGAAETVDALLSIEWYKDYCAGQIQIMIGYSDSAKDAGQLAAAWAQYRAQEAVTEVARKHGVQLTLFHGRGGAIGRGGGSAKQAIESQPPGSMGGRLRVTEQGEMIRFKLGTPAIAQDTLLRYLQSTLSTTFTPAAAPTPAQRAEIERLTDVSLDGFRGAVQDDQFVTFFQSITPESELAELALGSRPARRSKTKRLQDLRAIPWVFAWTQIRLMIPAWLGTDRAIENMLADADAFDDLVDWPFFQKEMNMLEMVLAKADTTLVRYYARRLTDSSLHELAETLIDKLDALKQNVPQLRGAELLADNPAVRDAILVRNTYLDPLHLLQAELLGRRREGNQSEAVTQALKVTMAGISSGLRNTG